MYMYQSHSKQSHSMGSTKMHMTHKRSQHACILMLTMKNDDLNNMYTQYMYLYSVNFLPLDGVHATTAYSRGSWCL